MQILRRLLTLRVLGQRIRRVPRGAALVDRFGAFLVDENGNKLTG